MRRSLLTMTMVAALGIGSALPACADDGAQFFSTAMGMGVGGLLGSTIGHGEGRVAATGAGMVLGGVIGNELGRPSYGAYYARPTYSYSYDYPYDMFPTSNYAPYQPNYVAPPSPPPPPPSTYIDEDSGSYCREFSQTIRIGNRVQESYGTACLEPDGSWHVVR